MTIVEKIFASKNGKTRHKILQVLDVEMDKENIGSLRDIALTAKDISEKTKISVKAIEQQCEVLKIQKHIDMERDGNVVFYASNLDGHVALHDNIHIRNSSKERLDTFVKTIQSVTLLITSIVGLVTLYLTLKKTQDIGLELKEQQKTVRDQTQQINIIKQRLDSFSSDTTKNR